MPTRLLPTLLLALLCASPARAISILVNGVDGTPGAHGAAGQPGGDGGDGAPATAVAAALDDTLDRAEANGGEGGNAGKGGDGDASTPDGGDGGDGGDGAAASATATNERAAGAATAEALARGGIGGIEGFFGAAGPGGEPGVQGEGGAGGSAEASATAESGSAEATAEVQALGGDSRGPGAGGSAVASARAETSAAGQAAHAGRASISDVTASGGDGGNSQSGPGGDGGNASSQSIAVAAGAGAYAEARDGAFGGEGGDSAVGAGGQGGDASSYAEARGAGDVLAIASAGGGSGGIGTSGGAGGMASARAHGESIDGLVNVIVNQFGGNGGTGDATDSFLDDAATGATSGELRLSQLAAGGWAGAGSAGNARSSFDVSHVGSGDLFLHSEAIGGRGSLVGAGPGGDALASARGEGIGDVMIVGSATGGQAFDEAIGGDAALGELFGRSLGGGTVRIHGVAHAGTSNSDIGRSIRVEDAVGGETDGALFLTQVATASAGRVEAGSAESLLTRALSAGSVDAFVSALGGRNTRAGSGGAATARLDLRNDAGAVEASVQAQGGESSGPAAGVGGAGGSADVEVRATSAGDGHSVTLHDSHAWGASGASSFTGEGGTGGRATSLSVGTALGDSAVQVFDVAIGGEAGPGGEGGEAISRAEGSNAGDETVEVEALARGGRSVAALGGAASASAFGRSEGGDVFVQTTQIAGRSSDADGRDSEAVDAVAGETAGRLTLRQDVLGGESEFGGPSVFHGGSARSALTATNPGGGSLDASANAYGAFSQTGAGGAAAAALSAEGEGDVIATARATGGFGTTGGAASIESVFGRSTRGGLVRVSAHQQGGATFSQAGSGADSTLVDVVDGETEGVLQLEQRAVGGSGATGGAVYGHGGSATSRLERVAECAELGVSSYADGAFGSAGDGADATSIARATNLLGAVGSVAWSTAGNSGGGNAATSTAHGGDASALAEAERDAEKGNKKEPPAARALAVADAGGGGLLFSGDASDLADASGGGATSEAHAQGRGITETNASAFATGGRGGAVDTASGRLGARGGDAHAEATAEGEAEVNVSVQAVAGAGGGFSQGEAGAAGGATIAGFGLSTDGGTVSVNGSVWGGDGAALAGATGGDALVTDAVSGETAGSLSLSQTAIAGDGALGGDGGRAESILHAMNPGGGAVDVNVAAVGGMGAAGGEGFASAVGTGSGASAVRVEANASGGEGSVTGGAAALGEVFGSSAGGGTVQVIGRVNAGLAGRNSPTPLPQTDAILENAVDGATSGALLLAQRASAFGNARSVLDKTHAGAALALVSEASGANARATADGTNSSGSTHVTVLAESLEGSDAHSEARATAGADGAAVLVNVPIAGFHQGQSRFGAHGGSSFSSDLAPGDAASLSIGTHTGDGEVAVFDFARGGDSDRFGQDAGSAVSEARASNQGRSTVGAVADAVGGTVWVDSGRQGGNAEARSEASGLGEVLVGARAEAGWVMHVADAGSASALALGAGGRTQSVAEALTGWHLAARAGVSARGGATAHASNAAGALLGTPGLHADAFAQAAHSVDAGVLADALAGNTAVSAALSGAEALALAAFGGGGLGTKLTLEAEIELVLPLFSGSGFDSVVIGFLDPVLGSSTSLRIAIEVDGESVLKTKLKGGDGSALDDRVLELGVPQTDGVRIVLEMKTKDANSFASLDFVVGGVGGVALATVPEPRAWLLLAAAGALAGLVRRARAGRRPRAS